MYFKVQTEQNKQFWTRATFFDVIKQWFSKLPQYLHTRHVNTWVNFFYVDPTDSNFVRQTWFYRSKVVYFDGYRFAFDLLQKAISHTGFLRDLPRWKWWSLCSWKLIHHHCADAQNTTRWNKSWVLLTESNLNFRAKI